MARSHTEQTSPHEEIDHRLRVRRLEQQLCVVADVLRLLAGTARSDVPRDVAKRIDEMLDRARL
jgi:hypothetical protein